MISTALIKASQVNEKILSEFTMLKVLRYPIGSRFRSIFNDEMVPSMFIYYDRNLNSVYFKDFSSGYHGDGIQLLKEIIVRNKLLGCEDNKIKDLSKKKVLSRKDIIKFIIENYSEEVIKYTENRSEEIRKTGSKSPISISQNYEPIYEICYNSEFYNYFKKYELSAKEIDRLDIFNLCYLEYKNYKLDNDLIIGYFNKEGSLIQAYVPKEYSKDGNKKFITIKNTPIVYTFNFDNSLKQFNIFIFGAIKDNIVFCNALSKTRLKNIIGVSLLSEVKTDINKVIDLVTRQIKNNIEEYVVYIVYDFDNTGIKKTKEILKEYKDIVPLNILMVEKNIISSQIKDASDLIRFKTQEEINSIFQEFIINNKKTTR